MKKILLMVFLLVLLVFPKPVKAATYTDKITIGGRVSGVYVTKHHDGHTWVDYLNFLLRKSDNHFVYCIQPGVSTNGNASYSGTDTDWHPAAGLTSAQRERISKLAYYGYGYQATGINHSADKWYAVTQMLIWKAAGPDWNIYFTDKLDGNKVPDKFVNEIAELESLVVKASIVPSFANTTVHLEEGESITITDSNNVLNLFSATATSDAFSLNKSGNEMVITAIKPGEQTITLTKDYNHWQTKPIAYLNPDYQNVLMVGNLEPVIAMLNLEVTAKPVIKGKIKVYKKGEALVIKNDTFSYEEIALPNVFFDLYNENDELVLTKTTDENGFLSFEELELNKKYYLQEVKNADNHILDDGKYYFMLTEAELEITMELKNYLYKGELKFTKIDSSTGEGIPDTLIEIFTENDEKIYEGITDEEGKVYLENLLLGNYYIKEKAANPQYCLTDEKIRFTILPTQLVVNAELQNTKIPEPKEQPTIVPVPNTGLNESKILPLFIIVCLYLGTGLIINEKNYKK